MQLLRVVLCMMNMKATFANVAFGDGSRDDDAIGKGRRMGKSLSE